MASELSAGVIDEASQALTSVVRLTLPAERWPAVGEAVNKMDDAVWAGDGDALRSELTKLRGAVVGTAPRARPGEGAAPVINPLSYRTTDHVTRTPLRWIPALLIGGSVVLAVLVLVLLVVLTVSEPPGGPGAGTTTVSAPPQEPAAPPEPAGSDGEGIYMVSSGVVVVLGILFFVLQIRRRRTRARGALEPLESVRQTYASDRVPPPSEIVGAVDRVVMVLAARRDQD